MVYLIPLKKTKLHGIFGNAYPKLSLELHSKRAILTKYIAHKLELDRVSSIDIDQVGRNFKIKYFAYRGDFTKDAEHYAHAVAIENIVNGLPDQSKRLFPTWITNSFDNRYPKMTFYIATGTMADVIDWLIANAQPTDYQIYTKYNYDYSVGFKNQELGTLFKMTFDTAEPMP